MPRTKLVNGEVVPFTAEEEAQRDAEEAAHAAAAPLREWEADMIALDNAVTARMVEDIVDALGPAGITLPTQVTDLMAQRKAKRNQRP